MKVNVTVDLSDFYSEDERDFSSQIKDAIAFDVRQKVLSDFRQMISAEFNAKVKEEIENQKDSFITETINSLVHESKVKKRHSSEEMITISQWIVEELERTQLTSKALDNSLRQEVERSSNKISHELKQRYDILFASQIVSKLNENGMLKEEVAKILLG